MDPIADMLTRIRNAQLVLKKDVLIPFSKLKYQIAEILKDEGFIKEAKKTGRGVKRKIRIILKYNQGQTPFIAGLKRISKPGQRIYKSAEEVKAARGGFGISIISTSKGLMTNRKANRENVGGEVICEIW